MQRRIRAVCALGGALALLLWLTLRAPAPGSGAVAAAIESQKRSRLCAVRYDDLASKVWSHRAHLSRVPNDASRQAVTGLLVAGITSFDVDISLKNGQFYVAHPTAFADRDPSEWQGTLLRLEDFLSLVLGNGSSPNAYVTIEPKFEGSQPWTRLYQEVARNKAIDSSRVAIICNAPSQLALLRYVRPSLLRYVGSAGTLPAVAVAIRSIPKTPQDFRWDDGKIVVDPSFEADLSVVFMPDVKLVNQGPPAPRSGRGRRVVAWVVDDSSTLFAALERGVDGVISNRPVELLRDLRARHRLLCSGGDA